MGQTVHLIFGAEELSVQEIERRDKEARRKTLGQLIAALRQEVELHLQFDALLDQFLRDRNMLVHRLSDEEGFDLDTAEGRKGCLALAGRIVSNGEILLDTFLAFSLAFSRRLGIECPSMPDDPFLKTALADSNRVWGLVSGPKRSRVMPVVDDDE